MRVSVVGNGGAIPRVAELLAKDLTTEETLQMVDRIIDYFKAKAKESVPATVVPCDGCEIRCISGGRKAMAPPGGLDGRLVAK